MRRPVHILALIAALIATATGCNTSGCLDNQSAIPLAAFYSSTTGEHISIDSVAIGGVGAPADSLLFDGKSPISQLYLPLRATHSSTSFRFTYLQSDLASLGLTDEITLDYTSQARFISEECGAMYDYRITHCDYTTALIDSVAVVDSLITNVDAVRLIIYFRTAQPDTPEEGDPDA